MTYRLYKTQHFRNLRQYVRGRSERNEVFNNFWHEVNARDRDELMSITNLDDLTQNQILASDSWWCIAVGLTCNSVGRLHLMLQPDEIKQRLSVYLQDVDNIDKLYDKLRDQINRIPTKASIGGNGLTSPTSHYAILAGDFNSL